MRRIGFFKVFVMDYPNSNGEVYPSLNFGSTKFSKEVIQELQHPQGSFFSISSHVDEGYGNVWDIGLQHAQEAEANGELFYPTMKPQATSDMESQLDVLCAVMGVDHCNLDINSPVLFASSVKDSVDYTVKLGKSITEPQKPSDTDFLSPWPTRLNFAGVWSNPVDVTPIPGHSFEEVKTEKLLNLARALKKSNAREYLKKTAEILGEDIEVDDIFLGESIKMIRQRTDTGDMNEVKEDSPEWAIAMVAFCRYPEIAEQLKTEGHTLTEVQRSTMDENNLVTTNDIYYLFDTEHDRGLEPFKPVRFSETNWNAQEQLGKSIKRFNDERIVTTRLDWTFPDDK